MAPAPAPANSQPRSALRSRAVPRRAVADRSRTVAQSVRRTARGRVPSGECLPVALAGSRANGYPHCAGTIPTSIQARFLPEEGERKRFEVKCDILHIDHQSRQIPATIWSGERLSSEQSEAVEKTGSGALGHGAVAYLPRPPIYATGSSVTRIQLAKVGVRYRIMTTRLPFERSAGVAWHVHTEPGGPRHKRCGQWTRMGRYHGAREDYYRRAGAQRRPCGLLARGRGKWRLVRGSRGDNPSI